MKNIRSIRNRVIGAALLAAFVGAPLVPSFTSSAQAQPKRGDKRRGDDRRGDDKRRDDKRRDDKRDEARRDARVVNYTGTVTSVNSGNSFDLSANGRTYNVYTSSSLPRGLSRGDRISVSGNSYGDNDVRGARVSILDNNRDDPRRDPRPGDARPGDRRDDNQNYGAARTYRGTVEVLMANNELNVRVDGRPYKVYSLGSTRDFLVGDSIEINGQMDRGVNIRNARITRLDDRNGNRNGNRGNGNRNDDRNGNRGNGRIGDERPGYTRDRNGDWRYDPNGKISDSRGNGNAYGRDRDRNDNRNDDRRDFATYTGEVVSVKSSREFRVRANGREYNVYTDGSARALNRGDEVRVYGRLYGQNDIRDARVTITRERYNDDRNSNNGGDYRTYNGTVVSIKNSREFRVRAAGREYDVYSDDATRGLSRGDEVRVYGRLYGANDIRQANVRITRDR